MHSPSKNITWDISSLLSPESRTPETEELVRILSTVKPQIYIDRTYQNELRSRLMNKSSKRYIFSLPLWTWVLSTAFAALVWVFALSSIFAPHAIDRAQPIAPVGWSETQNILATMTTPDTVEIQRTGAISAKMNTQNPQTPQSKNSESINTSSPSEYTTADMPMADMIMRSTIPTPDHMPAPIDWVAMMMTAIVPVALDDTTTIDTEIADIMSEINTIIHPISVTIPMYPTRMSIYEKDSEFTPSEISSHTGTWLTVRTIDTVDRVQLLKNITALMEWDQVVWEGSVLYQERIVGTFHTLIPVLSYALTSGKVISVDLMRGYD
jgi:hypothetical protein